MTLKEVSEKLAALIELSTEIEGTYVVQVIDLEFLLREIDNQLRKEWEKSSC